MHILLGLEGKNLYIQLEEGNTSLPRWAEKYCKTLPVTTERVSDRRISDIDTIERFISDLFEPGAAVWLEGGYGEAAIHSPEHLRKRIDDIKQLAVIDEKGFIQISVDDFVSILSPKRATQVCSSKPAFNRYALLPKPTKQDAPDTQSPTSKNSCSIL